MMKKSKISLFVLVILSGVGLVFLVTSSVNATAPAGTISYWKLDETPAGDPPTPPVTYLDSIPVTGNDGQDNGKPPTSTTQTTPPTDGRVNGAQQFDGTATGIDIPADLSFDWGAGDSFSIELWLRQPNALGTTGNEIFVGRQANADDNDLEWWVGIWDATVPTGATAQAAAFVLIDSDRNGFGDANYLSGSTALAGVDSDWHHIVAVRNALDGENLLYVDGDLVDSVTVAYTGGFAAADDLNIGYLNYDDVDGFFTDGAADEIALYNRALTPEEVNAHYLAGLDGKGIDTISPNPVANAGVDQIVAESAMASLDGSGSTGRSITYSWTAPAGITLSDPTAPSPTFTTPAVDAAGETLTFELTVTDDVGTTSTDSVDVAVVDSPVANAGVDQTVAESAVATLDGSGSTGSNITYAWTAPAGITLSDPTAPSPTFTAPDVAAAGETLTFELTVTDDVDTPSTDTDTVDVAVVDSPVANAGVDQNVAEGNTVTLDGSGSTGSNITYAWTAPAGITLSDPTAPSPTFTAPDVAAAGETLTFQLTVTDDVSATSTDTVDVNVTDASISPAADAGPDQTVAPGDTVTLDGTGSTGTDITYAWEQVIVADESRVQLAGADTATPTFVAPDASASDDVAAALLETLTFQLTVTDNANITSTDTVDVNVDDGRGGGGGGGGGGGDCFINSMF